MKNFKNPVSPSVTVDIDGEEIPLRFELEFISDAEDESGMALITGLRERDVNAPRISLVRVLLWALMRPFNSRLTLAEVKPMVTQFNCSEIWGKVLEAWIAGMKKPGESCEADPHKGQS